MSEWQVDLVYTDEKSNKFWRGRTDGSDFIVNYGRAGTDGQTKAKDMGSAEAASAELAKVAKQKRKKGYADSGANKSAVAVVDSAPPVANKSGTFAANRAGKVVQISIASDGETITTAIRETLASPEAAALGYDKISESLIASGYKKT